MTAQAQIRAVALFFFYATMDRSRAVKATAQTLELLKKQQGAEADHPEAIPAALVRLTQQVWRQMLAKKSRATGQVKMDPQWLNLDPTELVVWRQFQKESDPDEMIGVIWTHILGFAEKDIALGLGTSTGTVRYRVSRGLKQLGLALHPDGREE